MTEDKLIDASTLWEQGTLGKFIAASLLMEEDKFWKLTQSRRDLFPKRVRMKPHFFPPPPLKTERDDTMQWITLSGAQVTLPRISFLEDRV